MNEIVLSLPAERAATIIEALTYQNAQLKFEISQKEFDAGKIRELNNRIADLEELNARQQPKLSDILDVYSEADTCFCVFDCEGTLRTIPKKGCK